MGEMGEGGDSRGGIEGCVVRGKGIRVEGSIFLF